VREREKKKKRANTTRGLDFDHMMRPENTREV
jgi:hypothetical protein